LATSSTWCYAVREKQLSPNPRLQRTRSAPLRSPLSRKPFGDRGKGNS